MDTLPCVFGCGQPRGDRLEHYVRCRVLWEFMNAQAPLLYRDNHQHHDHEHYDEQSTITFLALHAPPDPNHTIPAVLLLHTFFVAYETLRARSRDRGVNDYTNKTTMLTTTLHFTITKHPELQEYLFLWDGRDHQYQHLQHHGQQRKTRRTAVHERHRP